MSKYIYAFIKQQQEQKDNNYENKNIFYDIMESQNIEYSMLKLQRSTR